MGKVLIAIGLYVSSSPKRFGEKLAASASNKTASNKSYLGVLYLAQEKITKGNKASQASEREHTPVQLVFAQRNAHHKADEEEQHKELHRLTPAG
jgi:hypothetical protein